MRVNPADEAGRYTFLHGFDSQDWLSDVFARILRPGDCMLDVGANIGIYTVFAAKLVGLTGQVHAFEASADILPELETNVGLNRLDNVHIHRQAVTDQCGTVTFSQATTENTGLSSIRPLADRTAAVAEVPAITLDSLLPDLPAVRLVKIDVEGAELLVLRGMSQLIERDRPDILLELTDEFLRELDADAGQVCDFLKEAGYEIHRVATRGSLHPVTTPPTDQCNILAQQCNS